MLNRTERAHGVAVQPTDESEGIPGAQRAQRFAVRMPLRYRPAGQAEWQTGSTENISRTGVLFRAERRMEVNTRVEMILDLRQVIAVESADIVCQGRVVRTTAGTDQPSHAIAATIEEFSFLRAADLPPP